MIYNIKFLQTNGTRNIYDINNFQATFDTPSENGVLKYIEYIQNILTNKLNVTAKDRIDNKSYLNALEVISNSYPDLVKEYFLYIKPLLKNIPNPFFSERTKAFLYMFNIASDDKLSYQKLVTSGRLKSLKKTTEVLNDIINAREIISKTLHTHSQFFRIDIGTLEFIGKTTNRSRYYKWKINDIYLEIFKIDKTKDLCLDEAVALINICTSRINRIINNLSSDILIDAFNYDEVKMLEYFVIAFPEKVEAYFTRFAKEFTKDRVLICKLYLINRIFKINLNHKDSIGRITKNSKNLPISQLLIKVTENEKKLQYKIFPYSNEINLNSDTWTFYFLFRTHLNSKTFEFSSIKNSTIKSEFKYYMKNLIETELTSINTIREHKHISKYLTNYLYVVDIINFLTKSYGINACADINYDMIKTVLDTLELNPQIFRNNKVASSSTIKIHSQLFDNFFSWVKQNCESIKTVKPTLKYKVNFNHTAIRRLRNPTKIILDNILDQVTDSLDYLKPTDIKRMLVILLNTPRRFDEVQLLTSDCIAPLKDNNGNLLIDKDGNPIYILSFMERKKEKNKQINQGVATELVHVLVNHIVAREIYSQIEDTKQLRSKNKTDFIFIRKDTKSPKGFCIVTLANFVQPVNIFIKKRNIKNADGTPWIFSSRQTRITSSYQFIKNGASLTFLKNQLKHANTRTTFQFYTEIQEILLADVNTEYFKLEFNRLFCSEEKTLYSQDELHILFKKFCLDRRKIYYKREMLGICKLRPGDTCSKGYESTENLPCPKCGYLITGLPCKNAWNNILNDKLANFEIVKHFIEELQSHEKKVIYYELYDNLNQDCLYASEVIKAIDKKR